MEEIIQRSKNGKAPGDDINTTNRNDNNSKKDFTKNQREGNRQFYYKEKTERRKYISSATIFNLALKQVLPLYTR